jgi:hypothetical protein
VEYDADKEEMSEKDRRIIEQRFAKQRALGGIKRAFGSPSHFCYKESEMARHHNILDYFAQDYLTPPASPALQLAIETAKSMRFEQPGSETVIKTTALAIRRLTEAGIFCFPEQRDWLVETATEWAAVNEPWMCYQEPWYVRHKDNLDRGFSPCDFYSCFADRRRLES